MSTKAITWVEYGIHFAVPIILLGITFLAYWALACLYRRIKDKSEK